MFQWMAIYLVRVPACLSSMGLTFTAERRARSVRSQKRCISSLSCVLCSVLNGANQWVCSAASCGNWQFEKRFLHISAEVGRHRSLPDVARIASCFLQWKSQHEAGRSDPPAVEPGMALIAREEVPWRWVVSQAGRSWGAQKILRGFVKAANAVAKLDLGKERLGPEFRCKQLARTEHTGTQEPCQGFGQSR